MSNAVFPTLIGLEWNIERTPIWNNLLLESASGKDATLALWSFPKYQYKLSYAFLNDATTTDLKTIIGFFNSRLARYDSWLYQDPGDQTSATQQNIGTGNGSNKAFQLVRVYGGFVEPIQNVNGNPLIYVNGVLKTLTTDYTVGPTGIITFVSAPGNGLAVTATFNFYWRCRFLQDQTTFNEFMANLWENKSLEFKTVKL